MPRSEHSVPSTGTLIVLTWWEPIPWHVSWEKQQKLGQGLGWGRFQREAGEGQGWAHQALEGSCPLPGLGRLMKAE